MTYRRGLAVPVRGSARACRDTCLPLPERLSSQGRLQAEATARKGAMPPNSCRQRCATAMETIFRAINSWFGKFFCCSVKENVVTHFLHCGTSQEYSGSEKQVVLPPGLAPAQASRTLGWSTERRPEVESPHGPGWDTSDGHKAGQARRHRLAGILPSPPPECEGSFSSPR